MSDQVRAARERLRPLVSIKSAAWTVSPQGMEDVATLADAHLAEHPDDEDEPITEEWLRSVGWKDWPDKSEFAEFDLYLPLPDEIGWECRLAHQANGIYAVRMCDPETFDGVSESVELFGSRNTTKTITRGQVRQLCKSLNIELKCP